MIGSSDRITAIRIAGFKSAIAPVTVNLKGITILAGANSAGKSTIMQPLLLLKQTLEKAFDPGALAIDGPLVRFTSAEQFFSHGPSKQASPSFEATYFHNEDYVSFFYGRSRVSGVDLETMAFSHQARDYIWKNGQKLSDEEVKDLASSVFAKSELANIVRYLLKQPGGMAVGLTRSVFAAGVAGESKNSGIGFPFFNPAAAISVEASNLIHLPGLRGNPERTYLISAKGPKYPGSFNDYVASIIHRWNIDKDGRLKELEKSLKRLGLTWRVTTQAIDDTRVEIKIGRLPGPAQGGARDTVNIADVGFGVSQTLPVLVALLAATPDQLVFVEQPEIHLHPRAQVVMADLLIEASQRGVRLVVETHSSLLILALQAAIAEQRVSPDHISMNWFTRDASGQTVVSEAELGLDGSYGDWPVDFENIEMQLQDRYMTLVDRLRAG